MAMHGTASVLCCWVTCWDPRVLVTRVCGVGRVELPGWPLIGFETCRVHCVVVGWSLTSRPAPGITSTANMFYLLHLPWRYCFTMTWLITLRRMGGGYGPPQACATLRKVLGPSPGGGAVIWECQRPSTSAHMLSVSIREQQHLHLDGQPVKTRVGQRFVISDTAPNFNIIVKTQHRVYHRRTMACATPRTSAVIATSIDPLAPTAIAKLHPHAAVLYVRLSKCCDGSKDAVSRHKELHVVHALVDALTASRGLWKFNCGGGDFMLASGVSSEQHEAGAGCCALESVAETLLARIDSQHDVRMALHVGPVSSGIIGSKSLQYGCAVYLLCTTTLCHTHPAQHLRPHGGCRHHALHALPTWLHVDHQHCLAAPDQAGVMPGAAGRKPMPRSQAV